MRSSLLRPVALLAAAACTTTGLVLGTAGPASAAPTDIRINEVDVAADTVELVNRGTADQDLTGMVVRDDQDTEGDGSPRGVVLPAGTVLAPGEFLLVATNDQVLPGATFGLGKDDRARLSAADGTALDAFAWAQDPGGSWSLCEGTFLAVPNATPGAANDCTTAPVVTPPPAASTALVVNEVESNGDDTDWVELYNTGTTPVGIGGYTFRDSDDARAPYVIPAGAVVPAQGFFVVDQAQGTRPGFDFGLGNADSARLYDPAGALVAGYSWTEHALTSYGRCPDGTGEFTTTTVSTKGEPNDCSSPVRINEVESQGGTPGDWVELTSIGAADVDASGYVLADADGNRTAVPNGTVIGPGGHVAVDLSGLGGSDAVTLLLPDGTTVVDEFSWTQHAPTSFGRCPDVTGEFAVTTAPTKGAVNECEGIINPQPWPGGPEETPLDDPGTFGGDLSGLDWVAPGTLWAVQNGDGLLYRIVPTAGGWAPDAEWTLAYPGGEPGVVDAEGVTVVGDSVYVSSERNNAASSVSRPAVLRYLPTGTGGTLTATQEWNLAPDFPGLPANGGLEGITWVPDSYLTASGFVDQRTGAAYDPARYPGHGQGLFLVGVEGTASVYAYALSTDGSHTRVATITTPFALVADVQFDPDLGALWVVCDEACGGRTALFTIGEDGAFDPVAVFDPPADADPGLANEGFAIAGGSTCVDGFRATFYADDNDTDGYSLRTGTFPCTTEPGTGPEPQPGGGTGTAPGAGAGTGAGTQPVTGPGRAPGGAASGGSGSGGSGSGAATSRPVLAQTGAAVGGWTALAAGLLLAGGAALVVGRRRHG